MAVSTEAKKIIKAATRSLGFDVITWKPQSSSDAALARMLAHHEIDVVLDVGANEGQYARYLRGIGFRGRIVSFEPCSATHERLRISASRDAMWTAAPRAALGNREGQIRLNVASNGGASSSVLPILEEHRNAAPWVDYVRSEMVSITRLDRAAAELLSKEHRIFLKVDVQGYELEVLEGAPELLPRILGVQLELSLVSLYEGQALFPVLMDFMQQRGFQIWGIMPGLMSNSTGRLLQTDVIFFRDHRFC